MVILLNYLLFLLTCSKDMNLYARCVLELSRNIIHVYVALLCTIMAITSFNYQLEVLGVFAQAQESVDPLSVENLKKSVSHMLVPAVIRCIPFTKNKEKQPITQSYE